VLYGCCASWFKSSRPRLPSSRSSVVENIEVEERSPIFGRGIISINVLIQSQRLRLPFLPELNGTTEEKGEYGRASSTVIILGMLTPKPFLSEVPPFELLAVPFR
jgi:hypothetical protein